MRVNKKTKIAIVSTCGVALVATSFAVLFWPMNTNSPINSYILEFNNDSVSQSESKNDYVNNLLKQTQDIFTDYKQDYEKTYKKPFTGINFKFTNLKSSQTTGEINYYDLLNRTLKDISPYLGINNMQRTPQTVNDGYYNKNTELLSFLWSPDYNSIGTWIKYMFTDSYTMSNVWLSTYPILKNHTDSPEYPWARSLHDFLFDKLIPGTSDLIFRDHVSILSYTASSSNYAPSQAVDGLGSTKTLIDDYYVNLANYIGSWVKSNSTATITVDDEHQKHYSDVGDGIKYIDWIASSNPNIPFAEEGPESKVPQLVRNGFYNPKNPNTNSTYRDWYIKPSEFGSRTTTNIWAPQNPFTDTKTPWNPSFSQAPNTMFAASNWTGLTSWTDIGDSNDPNNPSQPTSLVSEGAFEDITKDSVLDAMEATFRPADPKDSKISFKIRPIPWVDTKGNVAKDELGMTRYLSPLDFWAGFKGFERSLENGLNSNNSYFLGLAGLDLEKTLADSSNLKINSTANEAYEFTVHFKDPILTLTETLDILSKQYFFALPWFHEKVQNIINDQKYNSVTKFIDNTRRMDTTNQDFTVYYGCGDGRVPNVWNDLLFAAPYYISNVTEQTIVYKLSPTYYSAFAAETNPLYANSHYYLNFNLQKPDDAGVMMKRIEQLNVKYSGSYSTNITYEQFKTGELDLTELQSSNIASSIQQFPKDVKYVVTKKLNQSNVVSINLQIYQRWSETTQLAGFGKAENIILNENGNPMWDPVTRTPLYWLDEYGNYVFPEGQKPMLKTNISQAYADLIVKDFFTPGGVSQTIRHTINNSINWVSLKSLFMPGVTQSIQYSFMPYGVYQFEDPIGEYWDYAANKRYMTYEELNTFDETTIAKRQTGNMIWTYDELRKAMIK